MLLEPIGIIKSKYQEPQDAPFQGRTSAEIAELLIYNAYLPALKDIDRVTHLIVLYWAHLAIRDRLLTKTPFVTDLVGVFACRSPSRPNPISFCIVDLLQRIDSCLIVRGADAINGSLILDIKPYSSEIDCVADARIGWMKKNQGDRKRNFYEKP